MKRDSANSVRFLAGALVLGAAGCVPPPAPTLKVPAVEYASRIKQERARVDPEYRKKLIMAEGFQSSDSAGIASARMAGASPVLAAAGADARARLSLVGANGGLDDLNLNRPSEESVPMNSYGADSGQGVVTNMPSQETPAQQGAAPGGYQVYRSKSPMTRDYYGPLAFGDPGLSASLWKESSQGTNLFRDYRAWQPMDLITIVVSENSEGKNKADTTIKQESTIEAAITALFGLEKIANRNPYLNTNNLVGADSKHDYKGEGETKRTGSLKAKISAMVVEVLPSGILRIEGEKIITVNNDDEVMVISGLVRPEDVSSSNEVDSSKVANVRIDYSGKGSVGNAQTGGWLGNLLRRLWPL